MTIQDAYLEFTIKVNRNALSKNIPVDKQRFVILYNENQEKRILDIISEGNDERIREIQEFLKPNTNLTFDTKTTDRVLYILPTDYLEFSSVYSLATKGSCKDKKIYLWEIKDKNYTQVLSDNYNQPSFEYREAPFIVADDKINIFVNDFDINKTILTYYRKPKEVDISGYIKSDQTNSTNINPEGDDKFVRKVISMAAEDFARNNENVQAVNLNKDRIKTNT